MVGRLGFLGVMLVVLFVWVCPNGLSAEERYTVKSGDSLYTIAKSYGISVEALKEANGLEGSYLKPKQVLVIPNPKKRPAGNAVQRVSPETESYIVKQGDSLYTISKRVGLSVEEIKRLNELQTNALKTGQILILVKQKINREEELEELGDAEGAKESQQAQGENQTDSEPLGKWRDPEERSLFVRVVKTFLGVPYRLGGSTLKGLDCSAFVKKIFEIFNVQLPRTAREQLRIGKKVGRGELEEGDLIFFKTRWANNAHVGIYIGNNQFVHASYRGKEVRVDNLDTPYFNQRFINGVRIIELEKES
ncbi:MAG: LysM peptidoglycan-binding domain-containing protein [Deltaproteobacteria bacterium]|nr:LysM peptidoglycan-binding domain-containing protein [Deltaproteobacteria bacterium]